MGSLKGKRGNQGPSDIDAASSGTDEGRTLDETGRVGEVPEGEGYHDIDSDQRYSTHPVTPAILNRELDNEDGEE